MHPDFSAVVHAPGMDVQCLSESGQQYAIFLSGIATDWIKLNLPAGTYRYEFVSPFSGKAIGRGELKSDGTIYSLELPEFEHMVAVKITQ